MLCRNPFRRLALILAVSCALTNSLLAQQRPSSGRGVVNRHNSDSQTSQQQPHGASGQSAAGQGSSTGSSGQPTVQSANVQVMEIDEVTYRRLDGITGYVIVAKDRNGDLHEIGPVTGQQIDRLNQVLEDRLTQESEPKPLRMMITEDTAGLFDGEGQAFVWGVDYRGVLRDEKPETDNPNSTPQIKKKKRPHNTGGSSQAGHATPPVDPATTIRSNPSFSNQNIVPGLAKFRATIKRQQIRQKARDTFFQQYFRAEQFDIMMDDADFRAANPDLERGQPPTSVLIGSDDRFPPINYTPITDTSYDQFIPELQKEFSDTETSDGSGSAVDGDSEGTARVFQDEELEKTGAGQGDPQAENPNADSANSKPKITDELLDELSRRMAKDLAEQKRQQELEQDAKQKRENEKKPSLIDLVNPARVGAKLPGKAKPEQKKMSQIEIFSRLVDEKARKEALRKRMKEFPLPESIQPRRKPNLIEGSTRTIRNRIPSRNSRRVSSGFRQAQQQFQRAMRQSFPSSRATSSRPSAASSRPSSNTARQPVSSTPTVSKSNNSGASQKRHLIDAGDAASGRAVAAPKKQPQIPSVTPRRAGARTPTASINRRRP